jgi:hypothetical protein
MAQIWRRIQNLCDILLDRNTPVQCNTPESRPAPAKVPGLAPEPGDGPRTPSRHFGGPRREAIEPLVVSRAALYEELCYQSPPASSARRGDFTSHSPLKRCKQPAPALTGARGAFSSVPTLPPISCPSARAMLAPLCAADTPHPVGLGLRAAAGCDSTAQGARCAAAGSILAALRRAPPLVLNPV